MLNKYPLRIKNETGDVTIDGYILVVPDSAIGPNGEVNLAGATGDVTGPSSATASAVAIFNGTTGKVIANGTILLPPVTTGQTLGYLNMPQQSFSAAYPIVAADAGKQLYHPASDANARQVTIPANASIPFALGTCITITNDSANDVTVVITSDTLNYVDVGAVASIVIPTYNTVTIQKTTTTSWLASGSSGVSTT